MGHSRSLFSSFQPLKVNIPTTGFEPNTSGIGEHCSVNFKKWANPGLFCLQFHYNLINTNWKSIDGVHGKRTRGRKMVGTDDNTELWQLFCQLCHCDTLFKLQLINNHVRTTSAHDEIRHVCDTFKLKALRFEDLQATAQTQICKGTTT